MKKIFICDFEDSFTYNILSEIQLMGLSAEVVEFNEVRNFINELLHTNHKAAVILGPGPGHPSEYLFLQDHLLAMMGQPHIFTLGICLGHQLMWYFQGADVTHAKRPVHGQVAKYQLTSEQQESFLLPATISVQRYNSLAVIDQSWGASVPKFLVNKYVSDGEVIMSRFTNGISYQFHPESVGTSFPSVFFRPIKKFLL